MYTSEEITTIARIIVYRNNLLNQKGKKFFVGTLVKNKIKTLTVFFNCIVQLKFLKFLYFLHISVHPNWVYIYISVQFNF